jgi:hypothetical protein
MLSAVSVIPSIPLSRAIVAIPDCGAGIESLDFGETSMGFHAIGTLGLPQRPGRSVNFALAGK